MVAKKGYKQTEMGIIPEEWEVKRLRNILSVKYGKSQANIIKDSGIFPIIGTGGIVGYSNHFLFDKPSIILGRKGSIDKPQYVDIPFWTIDTAFYTVINENYDSKFLFYKLCCIDWYSCNEASGVPSLNLNTIENIEISIPDYETQHKISAVLSDIDEYILSLERLITKKKAIKQGAMQNLLTGKIRLKGFEGEWVEKKLGKVCNILRGGSPRPIQFYLTDADDGINWIKIGDVDIEARYVIETKEKIISSGVSMSRRVFIGDFILSNSMSFGRPYILKIDGCIHDGWLVIQNYEKTFDTNYLYYSLCSDNIYKQCIAMAAGSSVQNLTKEKVENLDINIPTLAEQTAIATILSDMDIEIEALQAKLNKAKQVKQGAMQQLLTGKIRLKIDNQTQSEQKTQKKANVYFRRSVWAAEIADRLCNEPTFGHVKMEKMIFLTENMCIVDIGSNYHRDAAGPYDNRAIRSIDSQLKKQNWFEVARKDKGYRYIPLPKRGEHKDYFNKYFSEVLPVFDKVIDTFRKWDTERCEIVATLYSAWKDLENTKRQYTDNDIINEVINNWNETKKRIPEDRWQKALDWMRKNGFAPIK